MSDITRFDFGGRPLTAVMHNGEPHIIARDLGRALEYGDDGSALPKIMARDWGSEFAEHRHFVVLKGDALAEAKRLLGQHPTSQLGESGSPSRVGARTASLVLLTEAGVDLVLIKTEKEVGKKLRAFLVEKIMPKLRRGETINPRKPTSRSHQQLLDRDAARLERERRLNAAQAAKDIRWIARLARENGTIERSAASWEMSNLAQLHGLDVSRMLPHEPEPEWIAPTEIAAKLGTTANAVGRAISRVPAIAARGNIAGLCRAVVNTAPGHGRTVTSHLYSPDAVHIIDAELRVMAMERDAGGKPPKGLGSES